MSDDAVRQIKERLNIVDVVGQYVQLQKAGRNYRARCPFHNERTPSFMVSPERGSYTCFGCGEKGDIFSFVQKMDGIDFRTALRQLGERAGVEVKFTHEQVRTPEHKEHEERLREACEEAAKFFEGEYGKNEKVRAYVEDRGVLESTRATWRIGYAPAAWEALSSHLHAHGFSQDEIVDAGLALRSEKKQGELYDRFRGRIMFPINDSAGRVAAFTGRHFEDMPGAHGADEAAKYVNSPETELFKKSRVLYGFDKAKETMRKTDCVMLVEGQFDVVLSHQAGLPFAVAVSGTALTDEHLALLSRMSHRLVLALDNDAAGQKAGLRSAAMALKAGFDVKVPTIEGEAKDPADLVAQDPALWRHAVRDAQGAVEFFLTALRPHAKDERAYKKLVEEQILPLVAAMKSKIDQAHFIHVVADRIHVPDDAVRYEVEQLLKRDAREEENRARYAPEANAATAPAPVAVPDGIPVERAAGMLIFHPEVPLEVRAHLSGAIGEERRADIETRLAGESERLCFEFDMLGNDPLYAARSLLSYVENTTLLERIAQVRTELSHAVLTDDIARISELNKALTDLLKKKHG